MIKTLSLLPLTRWLLNAATIIFLILAVIFAIALAAAGLAALFPAYLHVPDRIVGIARGDVLAIVTPALAAGFAAGVLLGFVFRNTAAIVTSAMSDDPFVDENARRLKRIGWLLVAQAGVQPAMAAVLNPVAARLEAAHHTINIDGIGSGVSPVSILTILLVFVLAQIFRRGAEMRSELEATV